MLVNNYDWMKDISFLEFIRDIGKCITVNYMMAKDSVKKRFSGEGDGMSFTEFTYQLVQGFDFLHLYQHDELQGAAGRRRPVGQHHHRYGADPPQDWATRPKRSAITCPLITKADGTKFGKTESGQRLARSALYLALQVLPVLAQRQRRGRQALHPHLHAARP